MKVCSGGVPLEKRHVTCARHHVGCLALAFESEQITRSLPWRVVLRGGDEMQRNVRRLVNGRNLETTHYQRKSLTHFGRLSRQFFRHFRVVRCDFIES